MVKKRYLIPKKDRRTLRRRNHFALDLGDRKFHQRVVKPKRADDDDDWDNQDWERFSCDEEDLD